MISAQHLRSQGRCPCAQVKDKARVARRSVALSRLVLLRPQHFRASGWLGGDSPLLPLRAPFGAARPPTPTTVPPSPRDRSALTERVFSLHQHARVHRRAFIACARRPQQARPQRAPEPEQPPPPGAILRPHHFQCARRISSICERGHQAHQLLRHIYTPSNTRTNSQVWLSAHAFARPPRSITRSPATRLSPNTSQYRHYAARRARSIEMSAQDHQGDPVRPALS